MKEQVIELQLLNKIRWNKTKFNKATIQADKVNLLIKMKIILKLMKSSFFQIKNSKSNVKKFGNNITKYGWINKQRKQKEDKLKSKRNKNK